MMEKAAKATIKNIRSHEFEKYLAVADPGNGDEFFSEVFLPFESLAILFSFSKPLLDYYTFIVCHSNATCFFLRLQGIGTSFQSLICLLRSSKRLLLQMWSLSSRVGGYVGGTRLPWHENRSTFPLVL